MSLSSAHRHKYRPYFSSEELLELIDLLKAHPSPRRIAMSQYLETFTLKIRHSVIIPALTTKPDLMERLGLKPELRSEHLEENIYSRWKLAPETCTPEDLAVVMEYRYTKSIMTPKEEIEYETKLFKGVPK